MLTVSIEHMPDGSMSAPWQGTNRMLRPAYIKPNWRTTGSPVSGELDSQSAVRARMVWRPLTISPWLHHSSIIIPQISVDRYHIPVVAT